MTVSTGTTTNPETADTWLQLNSGKTFGAGTSYSWFIIDLTEAFGSGNEPTAQQFYNKYNKYFSLIAVDEEITIDDKAGKILISRLPSEYQEVEYIESTGTQYIDTGVNTDANLGIDCHVNFGTQNFFGAIKDATEGVLRHHAYNDYYHYGGPQYPILNGDSTFELDAVNKKIYKGGTVLNMASQSFDTGLSY